MIFYIICKKIKIFIKKSWSIPKKNKAYILWRKKNDILIIIKKINRLGLIVVLAL